jgi:hypothetical protein
MREKEKPTSRPWGVTGPGKYDEHSITEAGGKTIAYLRKLTAFQEDRMDVVNGELICAAVNSWDDIEALQGRIDALKSRSKR